MVVNSSAALASCSDCSSTTSSMQSARVLRPKNTKHLVDASNQATVHTNPRNVLIGQAYCLCFLAQAHIGHWHAFLEALVAEALIGLAYDARKLCCEGCLAVVSQHTVVIHVDPVTCRAADQNQDMSRFPVNKNIAWTGMSASLCKSVALAMCCPCNN